MKPTKEDQRSITVGKQSFEAMWAPVIAGMNEVKTNKPQGEGWLTLKEFSAKAGCGIFKALQIMQQAAKEGKIEKFRGSDAANGRPHPQTWYRPIQAKPTR